MSEHHLGFLPPNGAASHAVLENIGDIDAAEISTQPASEPVLAREPAADAVTAADRAQLQRDIAAIERASAALRRADPAMESWSDTPAPATPKARPVWLLIGVLWLSTALVTIGAVFVISALVG